MVYIRQCLATSISRPGTLFKSCSEVERRCTRVACHAAGTRGGQAGPMGQLARTDSRSPRSPRSPSGGPVQLKLCCAKRPGGGPHWTSAHARAWSGAPNSSDRLRGPQTARFARASLATQPRNGQDRPSQQGGRPTDLRQLQTRCPAHSRRLARGSLEPQHITALLHTCRDNLRDIFGLGACNAARLARAACRCLGLLLPWCELNRGQDALGTWADRQVTTPLVINNPVAPTVRGGRRLLGPGVQQAGPGIRDVGTSVSCPFCPTGEKKLSTAKRQDVDSGAASFACHSAEKNWGLVRAD